MTAGRTGGDAPDDRPPRIVFAVPTFAGGGAERVVSTVAGRLAASPTARAEVVGLLEPAGPAPSVGAPRRGLAADRVRRGVAALLRDLRRDPPDAVVTTLQHVSTALGLATPLLPRRTRHVARIANTYSEELALLPRSRRALRRGSIRVSHRGIDHFVCVSEGVRDDLVAVARVPKDRCSVIANPVDAAAITRLAAADPGDVPEQVERSRVRFVAVGRLVPQKDHSTLLRAFAEIAEELDASLTIVGDGPLRGHLEDLARSLGVAERTHLPGALANPYPVMAEADVVVLSSRFEGMPNVLLEAMALGRTWVSTDCPHGPAELHASTGLGRLVAVGDPRELAASMAAAAEDPDDAAAGPSAVRSANDPEQVAGRYRDVVLGPVAGDRGATRPVCLVGNLGIGRPPNGQTVKARELEGLLEATGRDLVVVDVGRGAARIWSALVERRRGRSTVVTLNRKGLWAALAALRVARIGRRHPPPVLVAVVGGWLPDHLARSRVRRLLAAEVDEFLAETPGVVGRLAALGLPATRLVNSRDLPVDRSVVRSAPHEPLRLAVVGRIRADKGVVEAAMVASGLRAAGLPAELHLHGPVEDPGALRAALALGGATHHGCLDDVDDVYRAMLRYDFLLLASSYEGECMPGAVVEACFAALPSVVSDWKDLPQVVDDGVDGIVCGLGSFVAEATRRIRSCVEEGGLADLSRGALDKAAREYRADDAARRLDSRLAAHEL